MIFLPNRMMPGKKLTFMDLESVVGKCITLMVTNVEKEDDAPVYAGRLQVHDGQYSFVNEEKGWRVHLDREQLGRIKPVDGVLREILLGAEYFFPLIVGSLPENGGDEFIKSKRLRKLF